MLNGSPSLPLPGAKGWLALTSLSNPYRLATLAALIGLADWLFYDHPVGLSALVFLLTLVLCVALTNPIHAGRPAQLRGGAVLAAAFAPLMAETGLGAILLAALGTAYVAVTMTRRATVAGENLTEAFILLFSGWRAVPEIVSGIQRWLHDEKAPTRKSALMAWIVPLVLGLVFLRLFASANPLIDDWLGAIDFGALFSNLEGIRLLFWMIMMGFLWPFIFMHIRSRMRIKPIPSLIGAEAPVTRLPPQLFGKPAILRSLVLFNLLFAVQTVLDIAYLWGGVALPNGMSYAAYAHRGAYPLVVTALLAAGFVIAAMRPGSESARAPVIRHLVFLWTGQNVLLVVSSILRLDLYIEVYSLTYLRVAAFIWMMLVAVGLILIVVRILLNRSTGWLIAMNLGSLAITLYICFFVNFPHVIASYNVAHSLEVSGKGWALDLPYVTNLGPQAIPALDRYAVLHPQRFTPAMIECRNRTAAAHLARMADWRAWTYRDWQLARYLRDNPKIVPPGAPAATGRSVSIEQESTDPRDAAPSPTGWWE